MKNGTRMTSVPSSRAQVIACRTSACALLEISGLASATPPSLCSPSTSAGISRPVACFARRRFSRRPSGEAARSSLATTTSTPAKPARRARANTSSSSRPPITTSITAALTHERPENACSRSSATGRPSSSADRQAARVNSSESRLWRAELYGSRFSAMAVTSSPMRPGEPVQVPGAVELEARRPAVALELELLLARERGQSRERLRGSSPPSRGSRTACAASTSPRSRRRGSARSSRPRSRSSPRRPTALGSRRAGSAFGTRVPEPPWLSSPRASSG